MFPLCSQLTKWLRQPYALFFDFALCISELLSKYYVSCLGEYSWSQTHLLFKER